MDIESIFSPGGELESALPFYSFRRGQYEMAELVESALETCSHAIIEAGTGTGKSFAYLVPMLLSLVRKSDAKVRSVWHALWLPLRHVSCSEGRLHR